MGVAFAPDGRLAWGGAIRSDADLGGGIRTVAGFQDAFLIDYDSAGAYRWDHVMGVTRVIEGVDLIRGIATDAAGNVYAVGSISDDYDFGGGLRSVGAERDIFIVSYDSTGAYRWDRVYGADERDTALDVAVASNGDVCLAGMFRFTVDFGGGARTPAGTYDGIVLCLSSSGDYRWDRPLGPCLPRAIAMDPADNITIAGSFRDSITLEGTLHTSAGEEDIFLLSMDSSGNDRWSKVWATDGRDWPNGVTTDGAGHVTVTGLFAGGASSDQLDFGGGARTTVGTADMFLVSLDSTGAYRWDRTAGSTQWDAGDGDVAADPQGNLVVGTTMSGAAYDLGGGARSSRIAVAAYDSTGAFLWDRIPAASAPSGQDPLGEVVAVDLHASHRVAVTGRFRGSVDFGGGVRTEDFSSTIPPFLWVIADSN
jgi:hypothetical protein